MANIFRLLAGHGSLKYVVAVVAAKSHKCHREETIVFFIMSKDLASGDLFFSLFPFPQGNGKWWPQETFLRNLEFLVSPWIRCDRTYDFFC